MVSSGVEDTSEELEFPMVALSSMVEDSKSILDSIDEDSILVLIFRGAEYTCGI